MFLVVVGSSLIAASWTVAVEGSQVDRQRPRDAQGVEKDDVIIPSNIEGVLSV